MGLIVRVKNFLRRWMPENFRWRFTFTMGCDWISCSRERFVASSALKYVT